MSYFTADMIDLRDVTDRADELREMRDDGELTPEDTAELEQIEKVLAELEGEGGDHEWDGAWYPGSLIRDSYFRDYAQELAEDVGAGDSNATWPNNCIDWDQAARELRMDYSSIEIEGVTYWYR